MDSSTVYCHLLKSILHLLPEKSIQTAYLVLPLSYLQLPDIPIAYRMKIVLFGITNKAFCDLFSGYIFSLISHPPNWTFCSIDTELLANLPPAFSIPVLNSMIPHAVLSS